MPKKLTSEAFHSAIEADLAGLPLASLLRQVNLTTDASGFLTEDAVRNVATMLQVAFRMTPHPSLARRISRVVDFLLEHVGKVLYKCSWCGADDGKPVSWPPPDDVIAYWVSGHVPFKGMTSTMVIGLVMAPTEGSARAVVAHGWPELADIDRWASCDRADNWAPSFQFPIPDWSVELKRWPIK